MRITIRTIPHVMEGMKSELVIHCSYAIMFRCFIDPVVSLPVQESSPVLREVFYVSFDYLVFWQPASVRTCSAAVVSFVSTAATVVQQQTRTISKHQNNRGRGGKKEKKEMNKNFAPELDAENQGAVLINEWGQHIDCLGEGASSARVFHFTTHTRIRMEADISLGYSIQQSSG